MDGWIIAACALAGITGGAIGAWAGLSVKLAVMAEKIRNHQVEIDGLRHDRHEHANDIQAHEIRIDNLQRMIDKR